MAEAKGFWGCHPQLPDMTWGCELKHIRWHETPIYPWQLWPWQFIWCGYDVNMTWICFFHTLINYHIHHIHSMNMDDHQIWTNPVFHLMIEIMSPNFWMSWARNFSIFSAEHLLNADSIQTGASPIHSPYGQPVLEQKDPKKLKPQSASDL